MKKNNPPLKFWPVLGLVSAVGIAQQIVLVRIFSIGQWYHFAYLIISIAMLGIAFAGVTAALLGKKLMNNSELAFRILANGLGPGLWLTYEIAQRIPFEGIEIAAEFHQWFYAGLLYLLLAVPFFFVAGFVTLSFMEYNRITGKIYGVNLAGSGLGAVLITAGMYIFDPVVLIYLLVGCGLTGGLLYTLPHRRWSFLSFLIVALIIGQMFWLGPTNIYISQYKPLSYALQEPGVEEITKTSDPLTRVQVLKSPRFRETHGQLSGYPFSNYGPLPEQRGLFFDSSGPEPVHKFAGDTRPFRFLDYVPTAAGFKVADNDSLLILGAGGGTAILEGIYRDYSKITAVESSPSVGELLAEKLHEFSGGIKNRPEVNWVHSAPRRYAGKEGRYSHVYRPLSEGYPGAGAGAELLNENYELTVEALEQYLGNLNDRGVLSIPAWVNEPPRSLIRLVATAAEAAKRRGYEQPFEHLAVIRAWNVGVVVFSARPLSEKRMENLVKFASSRGFDLDYYPGQSPGASPQFVHTGEPTHSQLIFRLREDPEQLYSSYGFNVRPVDDNRPYFYQFFRLSRLYELLKEFDFQRYPHTEWGFLLVMVTLLQSIIGGFILLLLPFFKIDFRKFPYEFIVIGIYFGCLGLAYMAVEVALIQRLMLILHYPVYSVAVILAGLLVFSGLGSYLSEKMLTSKQRIKISVAAIVFCIFSLQPLIDWSARLLANRPDYLAVPVTLGLLFPLGFFMGIPFPSGLSLLGKDDEQEKIAWAWAVNGATSVIGAVLAGFIALASGYMTLFVFGGLVYITAAIFSKMI